MTIFTRFAAVDYVDCSRSTHFYWSLLGRRRQVRSTGITHSQASSSWTDDKLGSRTSVIISGGSTSWSRSDVR